MIYDRCRYHAIGRGFCAKITHCFINTQMDDVHSICKLFFKHVIGIFCFVISTILLDIAVILSVAVILVSFL